MATDWRLARLADHHPVAAFTCGSRPGAADIDRYLRESARIEQDAHLAAVWIVEDRSASAPEDQIVGFLTLSPISVRLSPQMLESMQVRAPYATIGGWLLGRMGVAERHQGKNHGALLVATAIRMARDLRDATAGVMLAIDPKNEALMQWYLGLDFGLRRLAPNDGRNLRLVMKL